MSPSVPRHILVPHDFSETAQSALAFALDLAGKLGAHITLLHVYDVPAYAYGEGAALTVDFLGRIRSAAQTALEVVATRARRPDVEIDVLLRQGSAWSEIDACAKESSVDLIVLGTHGRHGLARVLLGSVAEKVVRTAPCPVLTVHGPEGAP
ncbi:MAG TPA: universal stress protein [Polyangiaceae bacterium]